MRNLLKLDREIGLERGTLDFKTNEIWIFLGEENKQKLERATGESFEHVGSTSVRNLLAKPILDFLLTYAEDRY